MSGSCSKCNTKCTFREGNKSELFGFPCDMCRHIWCKNCSNISSTEIRALVLSSRVLPFFCRECIAALKDVPLLKAQMLELQSEIKELKEGIQASKQSYADVLKVHSDSETLKGNLSKLEKKVEVMNSREKPFSEEKNIEPAIEEIKERERRSANVLIFGVAESDIADREQRIQGELSLVHTLLKKVDHNVPTGELKTRRIGRFNKEKVRPIQVIFPTREAALRVLKQRQKADDGKGVYIKDDLTPLQRKYLKDLIRELEERTKDGKERLKIRYINSIPRIVQLREHTAPKN